MSSPNPSLRLFLSSVSTEFRDYRVQLAKDLRRPNVDVRIQEEEFKDQGGTTLDTLDAYVVNATVVAHLVGDMPGAYPRESDQAALLAKYLDLTTRLPALGNALRAGKVSYTQWEAWLALYHGKLLFIAEAAATAARGTAHAPTDAGKAAQAAHLGFLREAGRYPGCAFTSADNLAKHILASPVLDELAKQYRGPRRPSNLPFASLGQLFKGREGFLTKLHEALGQAGQGHATAVAGKALHGLGGVGKTRLAVEYAYRHGAEHSATLFVRAETPSLLDSSLAALAGPDILDLPEKDAPEDKVKIPAALGWLENHPGWLMILDNVDSEEAAKAVQDLLAKLRGGRVLITGRLTTYPGAVKKLELNVLTTEDAASFLIERTEGDRQATPDDAALATTLASELGGLALGLEQAGAYIANEHIGFERYLTLWRDKRDSVVGWFDKTLMSYDHDTGLAATWSASVDRLKPDSRHLLDRLAFFAPEPIPDSLLDVRAEGDDLDARAAIVGLYAYSLVSRGQVEAGKVSVPGFVVHRLVQDFARRMMMQDRRTEALREALVWVQKGFVGDAGDVRSWPVLDPLAAHASALADRGRRATLAQPTADLFGQLDILFDAKGRYAEAEYASRNALALVEAHEGPNNPALAVRFNNLAMLLLNMNRLTDAEPMMRRALAIDEAIYNPDQP